MVHDVKEETRDVRERKVRNCAVVGSNQFGLLLRCDCKHLDGTPAEVVVAYHAPFRVASCATSVNQHTAFAGLLPQALLHNHIVGHIFSLDKEVRPEENSAVLDLRRNGFVSVYNERFHLAESFLAMFQEPIEHLNCFDDDDLGVSVLDLVDASLWGVG